MGNAKDSLALLEKARQFVRSKSDRIPLLGIVAGSGLGALSELIENAVRIPYGDIPGALAPTVVGHSGELVLGELEGLSLAVLSGRVHAYEGHDLNEVVFNVRLLGLLGAKAVLLTNAAGGILPWMPPGSLCRITDHLNLTGKNPLIGENLAELGPRFPDMSTAYDKELGAVLERAAESAQTQLFHGVYAGLSGPSYETPAEIRMLQLLGASLAGMSTVHEAIALNHMGVKVVGLSCVTNFAAGVSTTALNHDEVKEIANETGPRLLKLVRHFVRQLKSEGSLEG